MHESGRKDGELNSDLFAEVNFTDPLKSGWIYKKSYSMVPRWKKRWFVLIQGCLYYFKDTRDSKEPKCIIPLDNTKIGRGSTLFEFILTSSNGDCVTNSKVKFCGRDKVLKIQKGSKRDKYVFWVKTQEERDSWLRALQEESSRFLPLHDFFSEVRKPKNKNKRPSLSNIPKPILEGWMRKRSSNILTTWNRRYFVLFPDFDGGGVTLFYYMVISMYENIVFTVSYLMSL